jgi:hypothetical protein
MKDEATETMSPLGRPPRRPATRLTSDARIDALVDRIATAWFEACRDELRRDGRAIQGGWPGTKAEARGRVLRSLGAELTRCYPSIPFDERVDRASTRVYAAARSAWLSEARKDDDGNELAP